jgi:short-subunit dehydrogenase
MNIIVTGGSKGIGKQTALQLARDSNNNVLITGREKASLQAVALLAEEKNIKFIVCDFKKFHLETEEFKKSVLSVFDSVDILINNAGALYLSNFNDTTDEQAREMLEINFFAPALIIRTLLPVLNKGAHIINIASMGGFQGSIKFSGLSYYSASKAAVACLSECLATEFKDLRITVNCLALGSVQTEMFDAAFQGISAPVSATEMGNFVSDFALNGNRFFNGKIIPVAVTTP